MSESMTVREWCDLHGEPYGAKIREYELRTEMRWILTAPFIPIYVVESTPLRWFKIKHPLQGGWSG